MEDVLEMTYVGHNHFSSKDKSTIYYVIQVLFNTKDVSHNTNKASLINIFVDEKEYVELLELAIFSPIKVSVIPNLETGKLNYKISEY